MTYYKIIFANNLAGKDDNYVEEELFTEEEMKQKNIPFTRAKKVELKEEDIRIIYGGHRFEKA